MKKIERNTYLFRENKRYYIRGKIFRNIPVECDE